MLISEARETFEASVASERGIPVNELDPESAVGLILDFFVAAEAENVAYEAVYLNWGTYDRRDGLGRLFEYVVWRQFFVAGTEPEDVDDGIWELEICYRFASDEQSDAAGSGGLDCDSRERVDEFKDLVSALPATEIARARVPVSVDFTFGQGG